MKLSILVALLVVYILWGGTYLAMKVAIETMPPFMMSGIRFLTAGIIVCGWQFWRGEETPTLAHCKNAAIVGVIMLLGGNGAIVWAEQFISSGIAAVVFATVPLWVALLSWLWQGGERPSWLAFSGLLLGISGIILLVSDSVGTVANTSSQWFGFIALVVAALFWAVGALYSRMAELPKAPFMGAALQMIAGGLACLLVGFLSGEWTKIEVALVSTRSALALGYLVFFGSIIGFSAYIWLLKVSNPTLVTTNTYVNPIVAVILGWMIAGEQMTDHAVVAAGIIICSVIIIHKANNKTAIQPVKEQVAVVIVDGHNG